jgi:hypothetical protein
LLNRGDRRMGALNPKATVTGAGKNVTLQEGLKKLLGPLGLKLTIRDEVVVITSKSMGE